MRRDAKGECETKKEAKKKRMQPEAKAAKVGKVDTDTKRKALKEAAKKITTEEIG